MTIHLISVDAPDYSPDPHLIFRDTILAKYPGLVKHMKRGDAVENIKSDGYRSNGVVFVDSVDPKTGKLQLIDRAMRLDDYGTQPFTFTCLDQFPPGYFYPANAQTNDMFHPGTKSKLYWHTDPGWDLFSPTVAAAIQDAADDDTGTLVWDGVTYHFRSMCHTRLTRGELNGYAVTVGYDPATRTFLAGLY